MTPTYVDILKRVGWPTDTLVFDFENYFDVEYTLKKVSTIEYITDARYECLGLAWLRKKALNPNLQPAVAFDHNVEEVLVWCQNEYGENLEGCTVVAQNAKYDGLILAVKYDIHPPHVVDTLGLGLALWPGHRNDLATLCQRLRLPPKGDTNEFKNYGWAEQLGPPGPKPRTFGRKKDKREYREIRPGVFQEIIRRGMSDVMRGSLAEYAKNDATQEFTAFKRMLPRLSRPEIELRVMQQTLELFWKPCLLVDQDLGEELAAEMGAQADKVAGGVGLTATVIRSQKFPAILQEALGDISLPMKQGKGGLIPALAKEDVGRTNLEKNENLPQRAKDLLQALSDVRSWPLHSKRVRRIMAQALAAGGLLPVPLKYCGAHTGRWSGDEKINLQNLSKRTLILLLLRMRALLVAPPGHKLLNSDASQIEARLLAWIADQLDLVEAFRNDEPIYCQFAAGAMDKFVRKPQKDDPPFVRDTMTRYRTMGKIGVLGCGYGMGKPKCYNMARQIYKIMIDQPTADRLVDHYRKINDKIVTFWGNLEGAFKYVTRYPNEKTELAHGLRLRNDSGVVVCTLPSGRELYYHGMKISVVRKPGWSRSTEQLWYPDPIKPGVRKHVYGGLLAENVVQAMARDVLAESMLLADEWGQEIGMRVGHHVHDEMLSVVPEEHAKRGLELQIAALRTVPAWAEGCPLDAEGAIKDRWYDK